jgi:ribonuclease-3 family protein
MPPKNANPGDYKYATGFEALLGYLYLIGENERLFEIIKKSIELINNRGRDE